VTRTGIALGAAPPRVLLAVHPGQGHLDPLAPLGRALVAAGGAVLVATSRRFAPRVQACGLDAVAVGRDWSQDSAAATFPAFAEGGATGQLQAYASELAPAALPDLVAVGESWRPDVVLRDATDFGALLAAEVLGLPQVPVGMMLRTTGPLLAGLAGGALATARHDAGLAPDPDCSRADGAVYVDLIPPAWTPEGWPAPARLEHVRHPAFDGVRPPDRAAGRPVVLMSLGTVNTDDTFTRVAVEAAVGQPWDLLVTLGEHGDPGGFGAVPGNVTLERYVAHAEVLPRCSAVITHAGAGGVMSALAHGLPTVCLPRTADQPLNAWRAHALGVGLSLAVDPASPMSHADSGTVTPVRLREAVTHVLSDPGPVARAAALAAGVRRLPGAEAVPALLTRLVGPDATNGRAAR